MPHVGEEAHRWRGKRIVLWKLELSGENTAFERCAFWSLDEAFPVQEVVFCDGACGDALWGIVGEGAVLLEETAVGG